MSVFRILQLAQNKAALEYEPFYSHLPLPGPDPVQVEDAELAYCRDKGWVHVRSHHVEYGWEVQTNAFEPCLVTEMTLTRAGRVALYEMSPEQPKEARTPEAESKGEQPKEPSSHRLTVDVARMTLTLDGIKYEVSSKQALRWVKVLAEHEGEWISATELHQYDPELHGCRPDRHCVPYLPPEILALRDSDRRKGSRIRLRR